ncbi:MAG: hypothetical protein WA580_04700 [Acidimicrobiales bacterium]
MTTQVWAAQLASASAHHHGLRLIILILLLIVIVGVAIYLIRRAKEPRHLSDDWKPPVGPRDGDSNGTP